MRTFVIMLAPLALLVGRAAAQEAPSLAEQRRLCGPGAIPVACARAIEGRQLPLSDGRARRDKRGLHLRLTSGKVADVVDDSVGTEGIWFYYLGICSKLGYYVLSAQFDEGASIRLVNARTGWSVVVNEMAAMSPDGRRFVNTSTTFEYHNPERLQVWRVVGDTLQLEWWLEPTNWVPGEVRWLSNSTFEFVRMRPEIGTISRFAVDTAEIDSAGHWITHLNP